MSPPLIRPDAVQMQLEAVPGPYYQPISVTIAHPQLGNKLIVVGGVPKEAPIAAQLLSGVIASGDLKLGDDPTLALQACVALARGLLAECAPETPDETATE